MLPIWRASSEGWYASSRLEEDSLNVPPCISSMVALAITSITILLRNQYFIHYTEHCGSRAPPAGICQPVSNKVWFDENFLSLLDGHSVHAGGAIFVHIVSRYILGTFWTHGIMSALSLALGRQTQWCGVWLCCRSLSRFAKWILVADRLRWLHKWMQI